MWDYVTGRSIEIQNRQQSYQLVEDIIKIDDRRLQGASSGLTNKVRHAGLAYNGATGRNVVNFKRPEYNLSDIANALDTESILRRSVEKYVELIWKDGFSFVGKNPATLTYIKRRFEEMAVVTGTPTQQMFEDVAQQLVAYANVFVSKARSRVNSTGSIRTTFDGIKLDPIAGYFVEDSTSMEIARKDNGTVVRYRQWIPGVARRPEWSPRNMIHMYYSRKAGLAFGTPLSIPVLDDIRALRRMEENVELLVFQHAIPLFHYKIGTETMPSNPTEVQNVQSVIENMPTHGAIVTPERHEIKAIGVDRQALDVEPYLEYFKKRIFGGLGMSPLAFGDGNTSNKSTSQTLDRQMQNTTEKFQMIIKNFIDEFMIKEILCEGNFAFDTVDDEDMVHLFIPEIDADEKRAKENHALAMYQGNVWTEDETRIEMGREILDPQTRLNTHFELIDKPKAIIQALDESFTEGAKQAQKVNTRATLQKISKAEKSRNSTTNRNQPRNQFGVLPSKPRIAANDINLFDSILEEARTDVIKSIHTLYNDVSSEKQVLKQVRNIVHSAGSKIEGRLRSDLFKNYIKGLKNNGNEEVVTNDHDLVELRDASKHISDNISNAISDIFVKKIVGRNGRSGTISKASSILSNMRSFSNRHLLMESKKAYNLGLVRSLQDSGVEKVMIESCSECNSDDAEVSISEISSFENVPPFKYKCTCEIDHTEDSGNE